MSADGKRPQRRSNQSSGRSGSSPRRSSSDDRRRSPQQGDRRRSDDRRGGSRDGRRDDNNFRRREPEVRTEEQKIYDGPPIPDDISARDLDKRVFRLLHSLPEKLADRVAKHLVMAGHLIDSDPETAHKHALAARARASRVAVVREAVGETAYAAGDWAEALSELRAAKRMNGEPYYIPIMADCERALGRPDKAISLATPAVREKLDESGRVELAIVVAGARSDQGQAEAALRTLEREPLNSPSRESWVARLRYAYADQLILVGRKEEAIEWFHRAVAADAHSVTDAEARIQELEL